MNRAEAEPEGYRDDDALWVDCPECRDPSGIPTGEHVVNLSGVRVRSGPYAPVGPDPQEDHADLCWRCEGTTRVRRRRS